MIVPKYVIDQNIVNSEIRELNNILNQQRQLKKTLLLYLEKISEGIYKSSNPQCTETIHSFLDNVQKCFDKLKENMNQITNLKQYLETILQNGNFEEFDFINYNSNCTKILTKINTDNTSYYLFMDSLFEFINVTFPEVGVENTVEQKNISEIYTSQITPLQENYSGSIIKPSRIDEQINVKNNITITDSIENEEITEPQVEELTSELTDELQEFEISDEELLEEEIEESLIEESTVVETEEKEPEIQEEITDLDNVLFISHKNKRALLPYSISDIENAFSNAPEKYNSIQDIIDKEYTVSLENYDYKNPTTIYDEAYSIAKNKSNYNSIKAMMYANSIKKVPNVNSLIIKSCNSVDEIDFYIKCLIENNLDKFNLFKIIEN